MNPLLNPGVVAALALVIAVALAAGLLTWARSRREFGTDADRAIYSALITMAQASPPLRDGLQASSATAAAPHLRALLNCTAVALTNDESVMLAWDGDGQHHAEWVAEAALEAGFADQSHMSRMFKRAYGLTPAKWQAALV